MKRTIVNVDFSSMEEAAKHLVDLKFAIDTEGRTNPSHFSDDLHGPYPGVETYGPTFGSSFLSAILPFVPHHYSSNEKVIMDVPTERTLSCSWRVWPDPEISDKNKSEVLAYIDSPSGISDTLYYYYPELSIYAAAEGKNRVNFCRFHEKEYIPAQVLTKNYPEANRIKLYALKIASQREYWAVLDNRYVRKVIHFDYALPILNTYGVETLDSWPNDLPNLQLVEAAFHDDSCFDTVYQSIDLLEVELRQKKKLRVTEEENELVKCGLHELNLELKYKWLVLISTVVIWYVSLVYFFEGDNATIKTLAAVIFGATSSLLTSFFLPVFRCKRLFLNRHSRKMVD